MLSCTHSTAARHEGGYLESTCWTASGNFTVTGSICLIAALPFPIRVYTHVADGLGSSLCNQPLPLSCIPGAQKHPHRPASQPGWKRAWAHRFGKSPRAWGRAFTEGTGHCSGLPLGPPFVCSGSALCSSTSPLRGSFSTLWAECKVTPGGPSEIIKGVGAAGKTQVSFGPHAEFGVSNQ